MMYIITHQVFELWFKLILFELESIISTLNQDHVDERNFSILVARLKRIAEVQDITLQQFRVIETMTPLDFLDFRGFFGSASGFQSFQYRIIENMLGLDPKKRPLYANMPYQSYFPAELQKHLKASEGQPSLFFVFEKWLERTPFLEGDDFEFLANYEASVQRMLKTQHSLLTDNAEHADDFKLSNVAVSAFYNKQEYEKLVVKGERRLSWQATLAALFISLYRDEPVLHLPFRLIEAVIDMDERFAVWRYKHALVAHKMIGRRSGSGGSSGVDYLNANVERNRIFSDLFGISTLLIPRSDLIPLPKSVKRRLDFYYTGEE